MLHLIDWKAELAKLESDNAEDCRGAGVPPAEAGRIGYALTEPSLDDQLLRMYVERELANLMGE